MKYASDQLTGLIHAARRRRQLLIALRGVAIFLFACAAIILLTGWAADRYRYNDTALLSLRVGAVVALLAAVYLALVRPLWKRVSDAQLGMLIEERRPDLSHRLVSAIEFSTQEGRRRASPAIVDRLLADANGHAGEVSLNEVVHRRRLAAYAASAVACLLLFAGVLHWGPSTLFTGVARLVSPVTEAASTNSLAVMVKPGTARVPKGSDQEIVATLVNFDAEVVSFFARPIGAEGSEPSEEAKWDAQAMEPAKAKSDYQFFIFNIQNATEYFVEANGVRSETFKLDVVDVPFVKQLNLTLSFPSYTRLAVQTIEDGGDITALKGTVALVTAQLTGKAKAARIVLRDGRKIEMRGQGETNFIGALTVTGDSSYHIELVSIDGDTYSGSNEHDITLLEDQPPTVAFEKPGRDTKATSVEEVFTQVKAEDDYGVASIEMFFSVNGGAEQKVNLQKLSRDAARAMSGVHTFFLEEHGLKPGDFISYYAKARDASNEVSSDIYFVEVKPFDMQYKQAQQQGGGGGGGGGEDENALTKRQKELIAATFRLMREAATTTPKERADNYNMVATGQERLRNDAREFVERIRRRLGEGMEGQEELAQMVEHLNEAARAMEVALPPLKKQIGKDALPAEQRALQNLLRADAIFREMQVASGNQEGGGGGQQQQSEELTDLFELELDKMKNQYETLNREGRQQAQQGKDEATRKLEELARRQQQALEQQQRRQQSGQPRNGGGGGGSQRQQQELIEETRKAARELERLSRERRDPRMQELSRQLNQAADDMQKAQAASESGNGNEAAEQNRRALERLEAARQRMGKSGQANRGDEVSDLRQRAADAAARQREITKDVEEMARRRGGDAGKKQQLAERKDALADALNNLEQDVEQAARAQNNGQGGERTGRQLRDAAASLRRNRVADKIRESKQKIENDQFDAARADERAVQQSLNEVTERLQSAEGNAKRQPGSEGEEALDGARQLADNLESLRRRLGENSQRGQQQEQQGRRQQQGSQQQGQQGQQRGQQQGQQGQQGKQGQQGQQGQQGKQGQQGSRGEQGGQSGQGGQKGGQQGGEQQGESSEGGGNSQSGGLQELRGRSMGGGSGGDSRQLGAELRERLRDAEDLRRQIGSGELGRELDEAMAMLKKLAGTGMMQGEAQTAALLKAQVIDPLRQIELELSRRLQAKLGRGNLRLGDEGSAPERYRKSVDEYYKRLSSRGLR